MSHAQIMSGTVGHVDLENYRAGAAKVFSQSFFLYCNWVDSDDTQFQSGLFKILFYDGMLCIVIASDLPQQG